jgi:ferritin-like metal-binding protein YciE
MTEARQRIIDYLDQAHTSELTLTRVLGAQIAVAPRGSYRKGLQEHLRETRDHARRVDSRLSELGRRDNLMQAGIGLLENALGRGLALGKAPLDLLRGSGGPEKVLNGAKDACAAEALEIATYAGIERLAQSTGDKQTAKLAASIRADEQRMLERLLEEIPRLVNWVVDAEVRGRAPAAIADAGASPARRSRGRTARKAATRTKTGATRAARRPSRAPAAARRDGKTAVKAAPTRELPISGYETLTADEVVGKLSGLSQGELAKIDSFEREHKNRSPIRRRIAALRGDERWHGPDELRVEESSAVLREGDGDRVRTYEGSHREAAEEDLASAFGAGSSAE